MMPLHDDPCIWPQAGCTCPREGDILQNGRVKKPARATDQEIEDDLRDQIANGGC